METTKDRTYQLTKSSTAVQEFDEMLFICWQGLFTIDQHALDVLEDRFQLGEEQTM